jgi:hypothetical protein
VTPGLLESAWREPSFWPPAKVQTRCSCAPALAAGHCPAMAVAGRIESVQAWAPMGLASRDPWDGLPDLVPTAAREQVSWEGPALPGTLPAVAATVAAGTALPAAALFLQRQVRVRLRAERWFRQPAPGAPLRRVPVQQPVLRPWRLRRRLSSPLAVARRIRPVQRYGVIYPQRRHRLSWSESFSR